MNAVEQADARALVADPRHPWVWESGMRCEDDRGGLWRRVPDRRWNVDGPGSGYCAGDLPWRHWPDLDDPATAGWLVELLTRRHPLRRLVVYFGPCASGTARWNVEGYLGGTMGHAAARALLDLP